MGLAAAQSDGDFDKAVYQEMLATLRRQVRPLTPFPPFNTVLILPDSDEEIMRGMFERFDEVAKAGSILKSPPTLPAYTIMKHGGIQAYHGVRRPCAG